MNFFAMQKSSLLPDTPYTVQSLQIVDYFIRIVYTVRYAPNILLHYQLFCITKKFIFVWQVPHHSCLISRAVLINSINTGLVLLVSTVQQYSFDR
ncbi:unknown [Plutella xylostella multiple nucleopolyhedrovirus]|uniref:Uncharacterized protein n=1 Tax=Plutella xylostella multiple nucleopolyhedrovirus TaxID=379891 RepID=Q0GY73_9ABAC|nr:unknown [Plutella xylostella multiple nucleopolyhedrovirus]